MILVFSTSCMDASSLLWAVCINRGNKSAPPHTCIESMKDLVIVIERSHEERNIFAQIKEEES
jgi:hypothetical protein